MHRDHVTQILVSVKYDFIFTASIDGFLKFWRKAPAGIESVRTYRSHMQQINSMALSASEDRLATCCS
jgi:peptidylprolyl isomerase domain and WD repeat-containing protein 1